MEGLKDGGSFHGETKLNDSQRKEDYMAILLSVTSLTLLYIYPNAATPKSPETF